MILWLIDMSLRQRAAVLLAALVGHRHHRLEQSCHVHGLRIGAELTGPVSRLSAVELMTEVQFPSRNIAEAFRATVFTMKDGSLVAGFVAFLSADGVIVQTVGGTQRLSESDIVKREESKVSLMPPGLLTGLLPGDFADLLAYMKSLAR